jgi:hypothetical protein
MEVAYAHRSSLAFGTYAYVLGPLAAFLTALFVLKQGIGAFRKRHLGWERRR